MQNEDTKVALEHAKVSHQLVMEVISEVKNMTHRQRRFDTVVILSLILVIAVIVCGFIWYLNQYDFIGTSHYENDYEVTGVYSIVDSDNNVIAQDISPEMWQKFLDWQVNVNGEDKGKEP